MHIDTRQNFKEQHRSLFNQKSISELKVTILGRGMSFGDIDAYKDRNYMYTYKTVSNNVKMYQIDANDFVMYLRSNAKVKQFERWQKKED